MFRKSDLLTAAVAAHLLTRLCQGGQGDQPIISDLIPNALHQQQATLPQDPSFIIFLL